MKKLFAFVLAATVTTGSAFASTGSPANTTDTKAVANFKADYNDVSAVWNVNSNYSEVLFFWHNTIMDAYYDKDGNLVGTFHNIKATELPQDTQHQIATWYKKYTVKDAVVMEKDGEDPVYYVTVESPAHIRILEVKSDGSINEFKTIR
ncbi:hypothetical protein [Dinghuibacter silviterrae]|uniref:PepSY-like beta-lactamase-inhibitor n=1 Tax=Dinghuibacter silviterrae TaxID=1539049 RepID=A0A4R8DUP2_9BACT|nr:hypothetical protein [Dinghuibacter silviterrae]TDX00881.1 hypothetical protein EDB95_1910 [Dinghuibacter silviterrae]